MVSSVNLAIVTGANGEIGFSTCEELARIGFSVIAISRNDQQKKFDLISDGEAVRNVVVSNLNDELAISRILEDVNPLEIKSINLVYAAAVFERVSDFRNVSTEIWDRALNVNLKDAYLWNKKIAEYAIEKNMASSIVNITSQAWMTGGYGEVIAYASSKGGLVSMTKALARVVAPNGVRVNCVAPGFIDTNSMRGDLPTAEMDAFLKRVPMMRLGSVKEVANTIKFLLSEDSSYITGVTIAVTGGQLMH
jgi:NAD(P)-dependent dehydrogenase (short-subunit alcohol dehydrogenase family)